jgi:hypothetical protein
VEDLLKMNARKELRDALLIRRMRYRRGIAKYPLLNPKIPTWRALKYYWALVRKHGGLAAANGFTVLSVF